MLWESNGNDVNEQDFHIIKIKIRPIDDLPLAVYIDSMNKMMANAVFQDAFIIDVDFTIDLKIGFHPNVTWRYFLDKEQKDEKIEFDDSDAEDDFREKGNNNLWRLGKYCIKKLCKSGGDTYEIKYYNKFMYFLMLGSEINKTIGCSLSKWCSNKSLKLAAKIAQSMMTGFTRIELRFEHQRLKSVEYYENAINQALAAFNES